VSFYFDDSFHVFLVLHSESILIGVQVLIHQTVVLHQALGL